MLMGKHEPAYIDLNIELKGLQWILGSDVLHLVRQGMRLAPIHLDKVEVRTTLYNSTASSATYPPKKYKNINPR